MPCLFSARFAILSFQNLSGFIRKHSGQIVVPAAILLVGSAFLLSVSAAISGSIREFFCSIRSQWLTDTSTVWSIQDVHPPPFGFLCTLCRCCCRGFRAGRSFFVSILLSRCSQCCQADCLAWRPPPAAAFIRCGLDVAAAAGCPRLFFRSAPEYFFILAWALYTFCHCGVGSPPRWVQIISGVLLGYFICFKPHFFACRCWRGVAASSALSRPRKLAAFFSRSLSAVRCRSQFSSPFSMLRPIFGISPHSIIMTRWELAMGLLFSRC